MPTNFNPTPHFMDGPSEISPPFSLTKIKQYDMAEICRAYPGTGWVDQYMRVGLILFCYPLTEHEMTHHLGCVNTELTLRRIAKKQNLQVQSYRVRDWDCEWHDVDVYFLHADLHSGWEAVGREFTPGEMSDAAQAAQQTAEIIKAAKLKGKA
jgi:hypothetical protein